MRIRMFLLMSTLVLLPALTQSEVLYLKDGSSIQGKLKRLVNDTLYFETSFGSSIRVPREQVVRIDFADSPTIQPPGAGAAAIPQQSSVLPMNESPPNALVLFTAIRSKKFMEQAS